MLGASPPASVAAAAAFNKSRRRIIDIKCTPERGPSFIFAVDYCLKPALGPVPTNARPIALLDPATCRLAALQTSSAENASTVDGCRLRVELGSLPVVLPMTAHGTERKPIIETVGFRSCPEAAIDWSYPIGLKRSFAEPFSTYAAYLTVQLLTRAAEVWSEIATRAHIDFGAAMSWRQAFSGG